MLRTVARVEERPWILLGLVFLATCFFGFLVQAAGSAWLRWLIGSGLYRQAPKH